MSSHEKRGRAVLGLVGLGVMGKNLALNLEEHGLSLALWARDPAKTDRFLSAHPGRAFTAAPTLAGLAAALERPRRILLLIPAGDPVDRVIAALEPSLEPGDILVDGGNSHFADTRRREAALRPSGLLFYGAGISGGERGARHGPSIMVGGDPAGYAHLKSWFEAIAAKGASGPCAAWLGPDGAGHLVKTAHNGIEYGVMQAIAESYDLLRRDLGMNVPGAADLFAAWNEGPLGSYLIDVTARVLAVRDGETGQPLIEKVLDRADQKGTGRWALETGLDLGVPLPTLAAALDARALSDLKDERVAAASVLAGPREAGGTVDRASASAEVRDALYASTLCAYAQGLALIRASSRAYGWGVSLREVARVWSGGSILEARLLQGVLEAFDRRPDLPNFLLDQDLGRAVTDAQAGWRAVVGRASRRGIPVPAIGASLAYFDAYRTAVLPQNLTQAQRDAFGAHTYRRVDRPGDAVHTDWLGDGGRDER